MDNFDLKKFVSEKTLLNESAPGFDTRKTGEALPTLESVKAAYEEKKGITYDPYGDHETEEVEEGNITEEKGVVVSPSEIMMHINQYQKGNIDGDDLAQAIEEIVAGAIAAPGMGSFDDKGPRAPISVSDMIKTYGR